MSSSFKASLRKITPLRASTYEKTRRVFEHELHDVKSQLNTMKQLLEDITVQIEDNRATLHEIKQITENEAIKTNLHRAELIESVAFSDIHISKIEKNVNSIKETIEANRSILDVSSERSDRV